MNEKRRRNINGDINLEFSFSVEAYAKGGSVIYAADEKKTTTFPQWDGEEH